VLRRIILVLGLLAAAAGSVAPPATEAGAAARGGPSQLATVEQAARLLYQRFFEPVDSAAMLGGALRGANAELQRQGANVTLRQVTFTREFQADWQAFAAAYAGAADAYSHLIDQTALARATISAMAESLNDCHTFYLSPDQAKQMQRGMRSGPGGQGVGLTLRPGPDGYPLVEEVYRESPAQKAGVERGDRLQSIDGADVKGWKPEQLSQRLREPLGQAVKLMFSRATQAVPIPVTVVRGSYQAPVYEAKVLPGNVGYLRLFIFAEHVDVNLIQQMYFELARGGATSLVLDLRNNPGGSGTAANALLSAFLGPNQLLFAHVNRDGSLTPMYSQSQPWPNKLPTAVLVNGRTGSASEIVAAVAQDYGVARLIGQQTKGCLASVDFVPLNDGSALGITGVKVVTAKQRSLNRIGVTPDAVVDYSVSELMRGEDPQLQRAVDWLRSGR